MHFTVYRTLLTTLCVGLSLLYAVFLVDERRWAARTAVLTWNAPAPARNARARPTVPPASNVSSSFSLMYTGPCDEIPSDAVLVLYAPSRCYQPQRRHLTRIDPQAQCAAFVRGGTRLGDVQARVRTAQWWETDRQECFARANVVVFAEQGSGPTGAAHRALADAERRQSARIGDEQVWIYQDREANSAARSHSAELLRAFDYTMEVDGSADYPLQKFTLDLGAEVRQHGTPSWSERNHTALYMYGNCNTPSQRDDYVRRVDAVVPITRPGKCLHGEQLPPNVVQYFGGNWSGSKIDLLRQFKFDFAFQNNLCMDYVDEKLAFSVEYGTPVVYLGTPNVHLYEPLQHVNGPPAIIAAHYFDTPEELGQYLLALAADQQRYEKLLAYRREPWLSQLTTWPHHLADVHPYTDSSCFPFSRAFQRSHAKVGSACLGSWQQYMKAFHEEFGARVTAQYNRSRLP